MKQVLFELDRKHKICFRTNLSIDYWSTTSYGFSEARSGFWPSAFGSNRNQAVEAWKLREEHWEREANSLQIHGVLFFFSYFLALVPHIILRLAPSSWCQRKNLNSSMKNQPCTYLFLTEQKHEWRKPNFGPLGKAWLLTNIMFLIIVL